MHKLKIILSLILIVVIVSGILMIRALQSPRFWEQVAMNSVNGHAQDVVLKEISIKGCAWSSLTHVRFIDVTGRIKIKGATYFISIGGIDFSNFKDIQIQHASVVSELVNVSDLNSVGVLTIEHFKVRELIGSFTARIFEYGRLRLDDLKVAYQADAKRAQLTSIEARCYSGQAHGVMVINLAPIFSYALDLTVEHVDLSLMKEVNPSVFDKMKAVVDGQVKLFSAPHGLNSMQAHVNAPQGGEIRAELLTYLAQYIPQRQDLLELIKANANVPLDLADIRLDSTANQDAFSSHIKLSSRKLSLDVNVDLDVHVDGGVMGLLNDLNKFK